MVRFRRVAALSSLIFCGLVVAASPVGIAAEPTNPVALTVTKSWRTVHNPRRMSRASKLPSKSPLQTLDDLRLVGVPDADPNWIQKYQVDGDWTIRKGLIEQQSGNSAALRIAAAGAFEWDAYINAGGVGGWFLLVGYRDGHGYVLYNVQLRTSGSVWMLAEIRDGVMIEETHREVSSYSWGGPLRSQLTVTDNRITFKAGKAYIVKELQLPNYHAGSLIVGTYNSQYGPKKLQLGLIRVRAR